MALSEIEPAIFRTRGGDINEVNAFPHTTNPNETTWNIFKQMCEKSLDMEQ